MAPTSTHGPGWAIRVPFRSRSDTLADVDLAARRELDPEDAAVTRELT